jgi:hypothetical protein
MFSVAIETGNVTSGHARLKGNFRVVILNSSLLLRLNGAHKLPDPRGI